MKTPCQPTQRRDRIPNRPQFHRIILKDSPVKSIFRNSQNKIKINIDSMLKLAQKTTMEARARAKSRNKNVCNAIPCQWRIRRAGIGWNPTHKARKNLSSSALPLLKFTLAFVSAANSIFIIVLAASFFIAVHPKCHFICFNVIAERRKRDTKVARKNVIGISRGLRESLSGVDSGNIFISL